MLRPFIPSDIPTLVSIWNESCGSDLAITPRFVAYNTRPATGVIQSGQIALQDNRPVGFVLASVLPNNPQVSSAQLGWIDAIAVLPNARKQNIGSDLLNAAEDWLRTQGCSRFRLGGSLHPFAPGYPVELSKVAFFHKRGYIERASGEQTWDVASDLRDYVRRTSQGASHIQTRPAQVGDEKAIFEFFQREFPGRWQYEFQEFLKEHGQLSNYQLLITDRVDGFARLTFADSERPIERFYMQRLPKPWGQLGPIGVSKDMRGRGFGGILLDAALCRLRDQGIRGCVIDWTGLIDFYGKFGFKPFRRYAMLIKN